MADGFPITPGVGGVAATDDCGASGHVQLVKLAVSSDGSAVLIPADAANGIDVDVTRLPKPVVRGYAQTTVNGSAGAAVALTVPANSTSALIIPSVAVRWRDDGTNPTATVGMPLPAGTLLTYDASLSAIRFIAQDASAGVLDVAFYG